MTAPDGFDIEIVRADPGRDAAAIRRWLADPHAAFWDMGGLDTVQVRAYLATVVDDAHQDAWLGIVAGTPAFYAETYDPAHVLLPGIHRREPGDLGMHLLISAPVGAPRHGLTDAVFAAVMRWCFDALGARRIVVEPDLRNAAIRRKNRRAGFTELRQVEIVDAGHVKTAVLSVCARADFTASELGTIAPLSTVTEGVRG